MISFFVPGVPVPQGRARSFRMGDGIGHYDDPKSKAWKKVVAQVASLQRGAMHDGPLEIDMVFFMPAPKSMKRPDLMHHSKRPDLDNLCKGVQDGLNGICYRDDSQICKLSAMKKYSVNEQDGVLVTLGPIS